MSSSNTDETEELIIKLLRKLQRKGKNIKILLWKLMDEFENEQFDEKNDEKNNNNINNQKITLLYNTTASHVCKVGHKIKTKQQKHLSIEPCIICGHRNNNNIQNKPKPKILNFLNEYNTHQTPFGPHEYQKEKITAWANGRDKKWPLHYAAITGDIVTIKELCTDKNIKPDQKRIDKSNNLPITDAAVYGQLESIIELMKLGANTIPPPDRGSGTPYRAAVYWKHPSLIVFFTEYVKYVHDFDMNANINLECYQCYIYDSNFNKHMLNGTMANYVYCVDCTLENVNKVREKQEENKIIERRIIKTIKENASLSFDTLCQMKDVKALHGVVKDIVISGSAHAYWLWLLDIDNFKAINTHLTHAIADTKIQALGQVLKNLEVNRSTQWKHSGYDGLSKVLAFRQGGDEFALIVKCNNQKRKVLQILYETLRNNINQIKLENMVTMKHMTVSIGVCNGQAIDNYEEMMKKADEAAEMVKKDGKNGIAIYHPQKKKMYKNFNDI